MINLKIKCSEREAFSSNDYGYNSTAHLSDGCRSLNGPTTFQLLTNAQYQRTRKHPSDTHGFSWVRGDDVDKLKL